MFWDLSRMNLGVGRSGQFFFNKLFLHQLHKKRVGIAQACIKTGTAPKNFEQKQKENWPKNVKLKILSGQPYIAVIQSTQNVTSTVFDQYYQRNIAQPVLFRNSQDFISHLWVTGFTKIVSITLVIRDVYTPFSCKDTSLSYLIKVQGISHRVRQSQSLNLYVR